MDTKFKKGQIAWNKGLKGICKSNKTSFKKGHIPWSKSQKGVCLNTGRTHFKKGHLTWNYKGDFGSYGAMHSWVVRHKGKANHCVDCGSTSSKKFEWANIDHQYRRVLEDYVSRCTSCHRNYDLRMGFITLNPINSKGQFIKIKKLI